MTDPAPLVFHSEAELRAFLHRMRRLIALYSVGTVVALALVVVAYAWWLALIPLGPTALGLWLLVQRYRQIARVADEPS